MWFDHENAGKESGIGMKKVLYTIVFVIPFVLGVIGYRIEEILWGDSLYNSISLYVLSMKGDCMNPLIQISRFWAPAMTASGLIMAIKSVFGRIKEKLACMHSDSTVVYSDGQAGALLLSSLKHGVASDGKLHKSADAHVIMFENDIDNVNFYQTNKTFFETKKVYMRLEKMDSYLLKESKVKVFNTNEIIARKYWKDRNLLPYLQGREMSIDIAIIGFGSLGQRILQCGLLNNIYSNQQRITYHIFGDSQIYQQVYKKFPMMNQDQVCFYGEDWRSEFKVFSQMERVILTEEPDLELVQYLLYACKNTKIDYFSKGNIVLEDLYKTDQLCGFGKAEQVYTEENIKTNSLYLAAMELNYKYACLYGGNQSDDKERAMQQEWDKLDGFTKGSNIASADHHHIRVMVMEKCAAEGQPLTQEELAEGEHIRWSRFHYLNHWTYGVPENGKNKDPKNKIHVCLVPYDELSEEEKQKDVEAVELLLELFK